MKKLSCFMLAVVMVLCLLTGCSESSADIYVTQELAENELFLSLVDIYNAMEQTELKVEAISEPDLISKIKNDEYVSAFFMMSDAMEEALSDEEVTINEIFYDPVYLIGPKEDNIGLGQLAEYPAEDLLKHIILTNNVFVHATELTSLRKKEAQFWEQSGIVPKTDLYIEAAPGTDGIMKTCAELGGYAVIERYVYEAYKDDYPSLTMLQDQCRGLVDRFCMVVHGTDTESTAAHFVDWMMSNAGQEEVFRYGLEEYGVSRYLPSVH
ncbi:MAG: hypothetical protein E7328_06590 [Clostridiales bacterium]|nr:hypothetical protein [Clostridiales bacterium]